MTDAAEREIARLFAQAQRIARRRGVAPERFVALFMATLQVMMAEEAEDGDDE